MPTLMGAVLAPAAVLVEAAGLAAALAAAALAAGLAEALAGPALAAGLLAGALDGAADPPQAASITATMGRQRIIFIMGSMIPAGTVMTTGLQ